MFPPTRWDIEMILIILASAWTECKMQKLASRMSTGEFMITAIYSVFPQTDFRDKTCQIVTRESWTHVVILNLWLQGSISLAWRLPRSRLPHMRRSKIGCYLGSRATLFSQAFQHFAQLTHTWKRSRIFWKDSIVKETENEKGVSSLLKCFVITSTHIKFSVSCKSVLRDDPRTL